MTSAGAGNAVLTDAAEEAARKAEEELKATKEALDTSPAGSLPFTAAASAATCVPVSFSRNSFLSFVFSKYTAP